jgi:RHS repeat-associated protein
MSMVPPTPPAGPVPAPFVYVARSRTATNTQALLHVGGAEVLVVNSVMQIDQPGNLPSTSTGGDVVTHATNGNAVVQTGTGGLLVGGGQVARTGDQVRMNVINQSVPAQAVGMLMFVMVVQMAIIGGGTADVIVVLDPISVASGDVVDENIDLAIPGQVSVEWKRLYSTARAREHTPLGRGGWTHSYHQWIDIEGDTLVLHDANAAAVTVPQARPREPAFHRGKRLVVTRDARGGATVFSLDTRLTRTYQPLGGGRAWLREIADVSGQKIVLEYESERLVRILDVARRIIALTHDRAGHITRLDVFPPGGQGRPPVHSTVYTYGPDGELLSATDALGQAEAYAYDEKRRLTKKTLPNDLSVHYLYDPVTGRCVRSWADGGLHSGDLEYDLEKGITRLTGTPEPMIFNWLADGTVVRKSSPDGSAVDEMAFDADGLLIGQKNAAGEAYALTRDDRGNITSMTAPTSARIELSYENDQVVKRSINGALTHYRHDQLGRLTQITYDTGIGLTIAYDELGRLATIHGPDGLRVGLTYDEQHNVVEERTPRGGVRRARHDALGRLVSLADPLGHTLRRELDVLGRPVAVQLPDGGSTRFEYDALGRLLRRTDALGRVDAYAYAGLKSTSQVTTPDGSVWSLSYDLNERLQQIKNPKGETFDLRYDRAGTIREVRSFDGRIARGQHGKNGLLSHVELPDGTHRSLRYDGAGTLVAEETPHGNVKIERRDGGIVEYLYDDPAGKSTVVFENDKHGRVVAETQNGQTIRYEYDTRNRVTARTLPTGQTTRFTHDEEGNVTTLDHDGYRIEFHRDLAGSVLRKRFASIGVEARRSFDPMMRLTREWIGTEQKTLVDRVYAYDLGGALTERNDVRWGPTRYQYDRNGMLLEATSSRGREAFSYDAGGSLSPAGSAWETGPGGLLLRTESADYTHDAGSRRTRETRRDGQTTQYLWDCRGCLREVRRHDGTRVLFAYDPFGRRIRKEVIPPVRMPVPDMTSVSPNLPRIVDYLWSGSCLAAEIDSERGVRAFVQEPGTMRPLLQQEGGEIYATVTDHLGTPTDLISAKGEVAWSARHSAFGVVTEVYRPDNGAEVYCPFRLLGQYHDHETDLSYVRHRYFDAKTARFLSPDPLEIHGGRNLFAFNGSPTTHVDPLGLSCIIIGNPAYNRTLVEGISQFAPRPDTYTILVHGFPTTVEAPDVNGVWHAHSPDALLSGLEQASNYNGERNVMMNSCHTGAYQHGVAQQVSRSPPFDGTIVHGPDDFVWGQGVHVGGAIDVPNAPPHFPATGQHQEYDPAHPGRWNQWQAGTPRSTNRYRAPPAPDEVPPATGRMPGPPPQNSGLPPQWGAPGPQGGGSGTGGGSD